MQKQVRFTLRLVAELNKWLETEATKRGVTKHALILQILWQYADSKEAAA